MDKKIIVILIPQNFKDNVLMIIDENGKPSRVVM